MINTILSEFISNFPDLYSKMNEVHHGYKNIKPNPYHLEGNIWTHTVLVMREVEKDYLAGTLSDEKYRYFLVATLCHDFGKCFTVTDNEEKEKRNFLNHEAVSAIYAKDVIEYFSIRGFERDNLLSLIGKHGKMYNYMTESGIDSKHFKTIAQMFRFDNFEDVIKFYKYDHFGRVCYDLDKNDNVLASLKEIKKEHSRLIEEQVTKPVKGVLRLMIGAPRLGKSTYIENINAGTIISRDNLVMEFGTGDTYSEKWKSLTPETQQQIDIVLMERFNSAIKRGEKNITVDMTNMSKKSRAKFINSAPGFFVEACIVLTPLEVLKARNTEDKFIPELILESMIKNFVYPDYNEVSKVVII